MTISSKNNTECFLFLFFRPGDQDIEVLIVYQYIYEYKKANIRGCNKSKYFL